ncbi:glycoside hydrolase superfamily [Lipomyces kononenkoae]
MSLLKSLVTVFVFIYLVEFCSASYDSAAKTNVALYWGQGAGQQRLLHFCQRSTVDIIIIGFVDIFPAQGNGYPGTNFGNQCWGGKYVYPGPGNSPPHNQLQSECPQLVADIPVCQSTYGKKIILSLGGSKAGYQLTGVADGQAFADFLWGAFGRQTAAWLAAGKPRPFDGPNNQAVVVDGFDFDVEIPSTDDQAGYIAMISRLRSYFLGASKPMLITGAPQCVVPDANMGTMIQHAKFDIIWIQFYNTPQCSARAWVTANPSYVSTGVENASGFSYNAWTNSLVGTASETAKLYIGIPGSTMAAQRASDYLEPAEASSLIKAYFCKPNFGGIMIWEATAAENNIISSKTYYDVIKNNLLAYSTDTTVSLPGPVARSMEGYLASRDFAVASTDIVGSQVNTVGLDARLSMGRVLVQRDFVARSMEEYLASRDFAVASTDIVGSQVHTVGWDARLSMGLVLVQRDFVARSMEEYLASRDFAVASTDIVGSQVHTVGWDARLSMGLVLVQRDFVARSMEEYLASRDFAVASTDIVGSQVHTAARDARLSMGLVLVLEKLIRREAVGRIMGPWC